MRYSAPLGAAPIESTLPWVLNFRGTNGCSVAHGDFWPAEVPLTPAAFFVHGFFCPRNCGSKYMISDGSGGAHALLWGCHQNGPGTLNRPAGNVWNGSALTDFDCDEGLYPGEWGHGANGWDGTNIYGWVNGVPAGWTAFAGPRQSPATWTGAGNDLLVGGSDHSNWDGYIAAICLYDSAFPVAYPRYAIRPNWPPQAESFADATGGRRLQADFCAVYDRPSAVVYDLSPVGRANRDGVKRLHHGVLTDLSQGVAKGVGRGFHETNSGSPWGSSYNVPQWIRDPSFPFQFGQLPVAPSINVPAIPGNPYPGARVFDTGARTNIVPAFITTPSQLTLGRTEGGTAGRLTWQTGAFDAGHTTSEWGLLHGCFVWCGGRYRGVTWVDPGGSPDMDVRIDRKSGAFGTGARTGLAFRVVDRRNFFYVQCHHATDDYAGDPAAQVVRVGKIVNGVDTKLDGETAFADFAAPTSNWTTLRAVVSGNSITLYCDSQLLTSTRFPSGTITGQTTFQTATGAGLWTPTRTGVDGVSGWDRWLNFRMF